MTVTFSKNVLAAIIDEVVESPDSPIYRGEDNSLRMRFDAIQIKSENGLVSIGLCHRGEPLYAHVQAVHHPDDVVVLGGINGSVKLEITS